MTSRVFCFVHSIEMFPFPLLLIVGVTSIGINFVQRKIDLDRKVTQREFKLEDTTSCQITHMARKIIKNKAKISKIIANENEKKERRNLNIILEKK